MNDFEIGEWVWVHAIDTANTESEELGRIISFVQITHRDIYVMIDVPGHPLWCRSLYDLTRATAEEAMLAALEYVPHVRSR